MSSGVLFGTTEGFCEFPIQPQVLGQKSGHVTTLLDEPKMTENLFPIFKNFLLDSVSYAS
jgi:hypothetical protein